MVRHVLLVSALAVWSASGAADAQVRSSTAGSYGGGFGQPGGSGWGTSGNSFGGSGSGFGASSQGGFGLTQGGIGQGGPGQGGLQQGGLQQGGLQTGPGGERGFVGSDAQDAQSMFQNLNGRERRRAMFDFALQSLNEMRDSRRRWENRNRTPPPALVKLTPQIDVAPLTPAVTAVRLNERLTRIVSARSGADVAVEMQGRTAVLRGAVASEHEKALAAKLAAIEPGVSEVENLLTVVPESSQ